MRRRQLPAAPRLLLLLLCLVQLPAAPAAGTDPARATALERLAELVRARTVGDANAVSSATRDPNFKPPQRLLDTMKTQIGSGFKFSNNVVAEYLRHLMPSIVREPSVPLSNMTPPADAVDCSGPEWRGRRPTPARIVDLYSIAYELDLLELRLLELDGLVDLTVLTESTYTHRMARKPLIMPHVWPRYQRWRDKIIYAVSDDAQMYKHFRPGDQKAADDWRNEGTMRTFPWERYLKAMGGLEGIPPGTLHLHGDLDGIPSRRQVAHFKYCIPARPLPAILQLTTLVHNFRIQQTAGGGHNALCGVFEAQHVALNGGQMPWRKHHRGARVFSSWPGWDITRGHGPYSDVFKELAIAEGGMLKVIEVLADPSIASRWHQCGQRTCCKWIPGVAVWNGPVPWALVPNRNRFPHLWPPDERVRRCPTLWKYWNSLGVQARPRLFPEAP